MAAFTLAISCQNEGTTTETKNVAGYEYIHHIENDGRKAQPGDLVEFHFVARDKDTVRESSREQGRPAKFRLPEIDANVSKDPIVSSLYLMAEGDSLTVIYPVDSMKVKPQDMGADITAIFYDLIMVKIKSKEEVDADKAAAAEVQDNVANKVQTILADYKSGKLASATKKLDSGLEIITHEEGDGTLPQNGQQVSVQYFGVLKDNGKMFDNSFGRGEAFSFKIGAGQVIRGWDEGVAQLKKGAKATLVIPFELAYGKAGSPPVIPEEADLVFYIEVEDIQ